MERMVNQTLWYAIMEDKYNGVSEHFTNDVFEVHPYDWNDDSDFQCNFWHKPSGFMMEWYKYPLRAINANMEISHEQFYAILNDCMNSVHPKVQDCTFERWWEVDGLNKAD